MEWVLFFWEKIKRANTDGFLADTSHFHFSIYSPPVDTSSCPPPNEKIHFLNATHALTVLPNLNLPKKKYKHGFWYYHINISGEVGLSF